MKILVTGGAGFIASHIVDKYIELGHEVIVVDNLSTGYTSNLNPKAKFYLLDICSKELDKVFQIEKPEIVNHHAAQISVPVSAKQPLLDAEINAKGFLNVLESCVKHKVRKVIFISSGGAVYGEAKEYPTSEMYNPKPLSPYAIHKFVSEAYLYYYNNAFNLNYTVLRYANVFGPRQVSHGEAGVVSIFIEKYLNNETPYLYAYQENPDGMIRDYVYVKDVVNANVIALEKANLQAINIGTGVETTTGELLREVSKQMNKEFNPHRGEPRPGDIRKSCLNIEKAIRILGWEPQYSLKQGVAETIEYFENK
ncbi:MAG: NAD-dependent epimerase/dehydratase family protein [Candidatus Cloacimonetes bacterium]|nr:NAD-dependent epimerase/dehydratase family protein [Candidatus Cloacimonadota bacterium]MDD4156020.1 NAD-dependent epimerase/dehydratase family protein [Candidatus Cloacimonadota bacterium]